MKWMLTLGLVLTCLLCLLPTLAQDDDDDIGPALDPALQWALADASWGRMQYDDAAVLMLTFASANPDHDNALEAYWRAYWAYYTLRPNVERRKKNL